MIEPGIYPPSLAELLSDTFTRRGGSLARESPLLLSQMLREAIHEHSQLPSPLLLSQVLREAIHEHSQLRD
jgi:hypothetical protein